MSTLLHIAVTDAHAADLHRAAAAARRGRGHQPTKRRRGRARLASAASPAQPMLRSPRRQPRGVAGPLETSALGRLIVLLRGAP